MAGDAERRVLEQAADDVGVWVESLPSESEWRPVFFRLRRALVEASGRRWLTLKEQS